MSVIPSGPASKLRIAFGADAHDVPRPQVVHLVVDLDPARALGDHVELLLLRVRVAERQAHAGPEASRCPTPPVVQPRSRFGKRTSMPSGIWNFGATFSTSPRLMIV